MTSRSSPTEHSYSTSVPDAKEHGEVCKCCRSGAGIGRRVPSEWPTQACDGQLEPSGAIIINSWRAIDFAASLPTGQALTESLPNGRLGIPACTQGPLILDAKVGGPRTLAVAIKHRHVQGYYHLLHHQRITGWHASLLIQGTVFLFLY